MRVNDPFWMVSLVRLTFRTRRTCCTCTEYRLYWQPGRARRDGFPHGRGREGGWWQVPRNVRGLYIYIYVPKIKKLD